jgi:hypothetical protein
MFKVKYPYFLKSKILKVIEGIKKAAKGGISPWYEMKPWIEKKFPLEHGTRLIKGKTEKRVVKEKRHRNGALTLHPGFRVNKMFPFPF